MDKHTFAGIVVKSVAGQEPAAMAAAAVDTDKQFCEIWRKAKPILVALSTIILLLPGLGSTAGAVLAALIKVGDGFSDQLCG